jgi:hypothetical protein
VAVVPVPVPPLDSSGIGFAAPGSRRGGLARDGGAPMA